MKHMGKLFELEPETPFYIKVRSEEEALIIIDKIFLGMRTRIEEKCNSYAMYLHKNAKTKLQIHPGSVTDWFDNKNGEMYPAVYLRVKDDDALDDYEFGFSWKVV